MYVSSFNTYINTESSTKTQQNGIQEGKNTAESFETKLLSKTIKNVDTSPKFPINYISNYKSLSNQQKLQENPQSSEKSKFLKLEAQAEAKNAYTDNSKIFSLILQPSATLDQTPRIDRELPRNIQDIKEKNLRHTMVNTYISNENYYRITS